MRVVGHPKLNPVCLSVENLRALDRHMESLQRLSGGVRHFFPKGVYRYRGHDEADAAWLAAVARDMAELARARDRGAG